MIWNMSATGFCFLFSIFFRISGVYRLSPNFGKGGDMNHCTNLMYPKPTHSPTNLSRSAGTKSFGEHPHQSTIALYWQWQPRLRFQLVICRLLSFIVLQNFELWRMVWKNDWNTTSSLKHNVRNHSQKAPKNVWWFLLLNPKHFHCFPIRT